MEKFKTFYSDIDVKKEWFEPGSSETEEGQEVSIKNVYERCLRGEMVPQEKEFYYEQEVGIFEHPDSDLADVTAVSDYLSSTRTSSKTEAKSQDGAAVHLASDGQENFGDVVAENRSEDK